MCPSLLAVRRAAWEATLRIGEGEGGGVHLWVVNEQYENQRRIYNRGHLTIFGQKYTIIDIIVTK